MAGLTVRWWWAAAPAAPLARLADGLAAGRLPDELPLKAGAGRSVWALPDVSEGVLLKHFKVRGSEALKYLVRPSRAHSEFRAMQAFERLGLPTVRALGFGERRERGRLREAWFLGRLVRNACTLGEAQARALADGDRVRVHDLARRALDVTSRLHRHPWLHRDLHAHNLLLTQSDEVLVMDLHSVWRVPHLTRRMRLANLARLLFSMREVIDLDADAPALLAAYATTMGEPVDRLVADAMRAIDAFEADYVRGRTARCLTNSSLFVSERMPEGRVFRRRTYARETLAEDLERHAAALHTGTDVLGRSARSLVTRVAAEDGVGRILKEYLDRGVLQTIRQSCGHSRARGAWVAARRFEIRDLPTPEALALLERPDGSAVLITQALAGTEALTTAIARLAGTPRLLRGAEAIERAALSRAVGDLVGRLARAGLRHADLSAKNVLATASAPPRTHDLRVHAHAGSPSVWLIDLDGLKAMAPHDPDGLARMLGQLGDLPPGVTRADRLRFRHAYAAAAGRDLPPSVTKDAARRALLRAERRARHTRPAVDGRASI
ncbi:MAG: lipopolysaccharide kinase InaA family protein [Casimicrobiaceae bacterium]